MKQMTTERQRVLMLGPGEGSLNERLVWLKKELEKERSRNDMLHHAYLPRPIAEMVRHGKIPHGGNFQNLYLILNKCFKKGLGHYFYTNFNRFLKSCARLYCDTKI